MDKGCDGEGRIQGGIALVLPWWPIKVFRPCPSYLQGIYNSYLIRSLDHSFLTTPFI